MSDKVKVTYKGKSRNIPKKYIGTLKGEEKKKQIKSIVEGKKRPETSARNRRSTWTVKFDKKYGEQLEKMKGGKSKKNISKVTGIPLPAVNAVFKKGEGAYSTSGSRPNQTPQSWAYARLFSYILGGPARKADKEITAKYKVKFPR